MRSSIEALKGRESIAQGKRSAALGTQDPQVRALKERKKNGANSFSHTLLGAGSRREGSDSVEREVESEWTYVLITGRLEF